MLKNVFAITYEYGNFDVSRTQTIRDKFTTILNNLEPTDVGDSTEKILEYISTNFSVEKDYYVSFFSNC